MVTILPLGMSQSTVGKVVYLAAKMGGFFLDSFVNDVYNFIVFACSLSSLANGSCLSSVSEFSVGEDTGDTSGLGRMCTGGLFGLLELH